MKEFKHAVETANISPELKNSAQEEATKILFTLVPATPLNAKHAWLYSMLPQNQMSYETVL